LSHDSSPPPSPARSVAGENYKRVTNGLDYNGTTCGEGPCAAFPYRYFPVALDPTFALCVDSCPSNITSAVKVCPGQEGQAEYTVTSGGNDHVCTSSPGDFKLSCHQVVSSTTPKFGHFCVPTLGSSGSGSSGQDALVRVVGGLQHAWKTIGVSLIVCVALSFAVLLFIRACGGVFVFSLIVGTLVCLLWGGALAGSKSKDGALDPDVRTSFKWFSYGLYGLGAVFTVLALFLRHQIRLSISVIKEGTHAVTEMKSMLLVPLAKWLLLTLLFASWIAVAICLVASGALQSVTGDGVSVTLHHIFGVESYQTFSVDTETRKLLLYHLFGLFWTSNLIVFLGSTVISVAVGFWYFHRHDQGFDAAGLAVGRGFRLACREHFGSVAFGAAVIAVVEYARAFLSYLQAQLKKAGSNRVAKAVLCSCACCLWMVDKCLKFVLGEAFILVALEGQAFCASCKSAFSLIFHNAASLGTLHMIGHLSVLFGKVFITSGTTVFAYLLMTDSSIDRPDFATDEPLAPCLVVALLSYFVASTFMMVYGQTINTLLVCYIMEESLTGSASHCSDGLHDFVKDARSSGMGRSDSRVVHANANGGAGASLIAYEAPSAAQV
jgi:hypothetical protein